MNSVQAKLFKLCDEPLTYHMYKRGDLIERIQNNKTLNWNEEMARRSLIKTLASEKQEKINNELIRLKRLTNDSNIPKKPVRK